MGLDVDAYCGYATSSKETIDAAFAAAEQWVLKNAGGCDGFLALGSLDCGDSRWFLEQAIGRKIDHSIGIWPADEVRRLSDAAVWPDPSSVPDDERWAYWSARKFLEVCVAHGLGIWTS